MTIVIPTKLKKLLTEEDCQGVVKKLMIPKKHAYSIVRERLNTIASSDITTREDALKLLTDNSRANEELRRAQMNEIALTLSYFSEEEINQIRKEASAFAERRHKLRGRG